ncbi:MAG: 2-oxoglutarate oxidoreductase [Proteobacteria bacterium]|jgi:2-oxoglutarate/2-oxoacid ferredoxin oxidoreductase subunit beta|nr:2-oxoglutarate oxidoreductase [Pseudomonadota bacterium]
MFGLKSDWSLDIPSKYFTLDDYEGAIARWCPGCGDHAVLTSVMKICRDHQLDPDHTVNVSGIGCAARFPHYMSTFGFHGLHGRALPVACGVKARRPDLNVWVSTGDGDCCSIGAGHWIHSVRYNMDMVVMLFDNNIYGLTKKQTSPTTHSGEKTNTHPRGAWLPPLNPLASVLGFTNVSFLAQTVDWNPVHLHATLEAAFNHKGLSFVRILQRCPTYTAHVFEEAQKDPANCLLLTHENGIKVDPVISKIFPNQREHDPMDIGTARALADVAEPYPVGLLFCDPSRPRYDEFATIGMDMDPDEKIVALNAALDVFAV